MTPRGPHARGNADERAQAKAARPPAGAPASAIARWTGRSRRLVGALALAALCACRREPAPQPSPAAEAWVVVETRRGLASHYGARFAGRRTASGEPHDPTQLMAAHRSLPFGTLVRVSRPARATRDAGVASVVVRINDRGPYTEGRLIDLSDAAAARLGLLGTVGEVKIEVLAAPRPP